MSPGQIVDYTNREVGVIRRISLHESLCSSAYKMLAQRLILTPDNPKINYEVVEYNYLIGLLAKQRFFIGQTAVESYSMQKNTFFFKTNNAKLC